MGTSAWHKTEVEYMCISNYHEIGAPSSLGLRSNIAYYVTGELPSKANEVKIVANQNNPNSQQVVRQQMATAATTLV